MDDKIRLIIRSLGETRIKLNEDLTEYLCSGMGGPAKAFYIATTVKELVKSVEICRELKISFLLIGMGSKIAISKEGFNGLAIKNRVDNLKIFGIKGKVSKTGIGVEEALIEAESGVSLKRLAEYASTQGLVGFEVFRNTLGTIGGCYYLNPSLRAKSTQVRVLAKNGQVKDKEPKNLIKEDIILAVVFKLKSKFV